MAGAWLAQWPALLEPPFGPQAVSLLSHGLAAAAFLALAAIALWRRATRATVHTIRFPAFASAALATACWAALAAAGSVADGAQVLLIDAPEVLRTAAWMQLLVCLGSEGARRRQWTLALWLAAVVQLGAALLAWPGPGVGAEAGAETGAGAGASALLTVLRLVLAVTGMLLVEQVYRAAPEAARWGVKLACLGIGTLFAYDFYLYADTLLFRRVQGDIWAALGVVNALSAPLLAVALLRNPAWDHRLQLSRQMMFRSVALLGAGCYLLAMAASAWYLRLVGGLWGPLMQVAFLCGAALLLAALLFSGAARARLKIFIGKHFYRGRYDYRDEWQRFTHGLGDDDGPLAERAIAALAGLVESPSGVLWLRDDDATYRPVAAWNMALPGGQEPQHGALCQLMAQRHWVIEADAWRRGAGNYGALAMPQWLAAAPSLWLVAPLLLDGRLSGFVCLASPRTPLAVDWEVRDVLRIAGRQAATMLAHRASASSLAVARQFESFNRMSAFVAHDLKNLVAQLTLLLSNAGRHKADPQFQDDMLATVQHSLAKMQQLLVRLGRDQAPAQASSQELHQRGDLAPLGDVLRQALTSCVDMSPQPVLTMDDDDLAVLAQPQRLARVFGHLIVNAVEATPGDGSVAVRVRRAGAAAVIEVRDTGCGMSAQFQRERLFQPFETTKPAGMGIGVFESRQYVQELGGRIEVESSAGGGTTFRVTLPLAQHAFPGE